MASLKKKKPIYQTINGILVPGTFSPKCFREALQYKTKTDDLFIVTYPKCGTTWMQSLVLHIFRKGVPLDEPGQIFSACPFIDMLGLDGIERMLKPGSIKTHLPFTHIPYSPEAKYIFVARNPLDACVSLYHHTRMIPGLGYWDGLFDDFFELFLAGEVQYNDYFDHLLSWYPHRNDKNVYFTTYEDMKADPKKVVLDVSDFIGKEYKELFEKDNVALNNVVHYSSFDYMKQNVSGHHDSFSQREKILANPKSPEGLKYLVQQTSSLDLPDTLPKAEFVRKGIIGDWRNHFSEDQANRLKAKFHDKAKGSNLLQLWDL